MADEHDLGSCAVRRGGSSPPFPTARNHRQNLQTLSSFHPVALAECSVLGPLLHLCQFDCEKPNVSSEAIRNYFVKLDETGQMRAFFSYPPLADFILPQSGRTYLMKKPKATSQRMDMIHYRLRF